jgi:hypothetical protein
MRTKIGMLAILTAVLLAFGGTAVAQDYGTETDPQDTTATQPAMQDEDVDVDVEADGEIEVEAEAETDNDLVADDQLGDDEFAADEELPRTATFLPALGALGLMSLAGGAALRGRKS